MAESHNMAARQNRLLGFFNFLNQNLSASDQIEAGEVQALLEEIRLTDDEVDNLESLLERIKGEANFEVPDWISNNMKMYLEVIDLLGIQPDSRKDLIGHHAALSIAMIKLAKNVRNLKPRSPFASLPATREQTRQMAEHGPERVKLVSDTIHAELEVILETAREGMSQPNDSEVHQGEEMVPSRRELAEKKLNSLRQEANYSEQLIKIQNAYNKIRSQSDKEVLAIFKFALKVVAALATALIIISRWFPKGELSTEPKPLPSQTPFSG